MAISIWEKISYQPTSEQASGGTTASISNDYKGKVSRRRGGKDSKVGSKSRSRRY